MPTNDAIFDGSSATWTPSGGSPAAIAPLTNYDYSDDIADIDDTGSDDTEHTSEDGRSDEKMSLDGLGSPASGISAGAIGAVSITLSDAGSTSVSPAVLEEVNCEGSLDDDMKTSVKMAPAGASAQSTAVSHTGPSSTTIKKFNGTTVTFGGSGLSGKKLVSVHATSKVSLADVGGSGDTTKLYAPGKPQRSVDVEVVGSATVAKGATGALTIAWADGGGFGTMAHALCIKRGRGGGLGGKITTKYTFKPVRSA